MSEKQTIEKVSFVDKLLNFIEVVGNKLPDPVMIFVGLTILVMIVSAMVASQGVSVVHPGNGETMPAINLLSIDQLQAAMGNVVGNFQGFPPLGLVIVVMIGAGLAEKSKYMETLMKNSVTKVPKSMLTLMVLFIGILANAAADAGFIILPPLAAIMYKSVGRNPLLGLFVAFVAVAAGFSANLIVNLLDVLLAGFTINAAQSIDPNIELTAAMNIYFNIALTFVLSVVGYFVAEKIVSPRIDKLELDGDLMDEEEVEITQTEKTAIKYANISVLIYAIILVLLAVIPIYGSPFLVGEADAIINSNSPFMRGLVPIITLLFFIPGLVYGIKTNQIKSASDAVKLISQSLGELGGYILLAFVASQFISLFNQSHLGIILAVNGAHFIQNIGLSGGALIVAFILFSGLLNLFIGSASAKWAMLAPIFVPMFMLLGYEPALTQMAFRIGDSMSNPISPLFPYFPMIIGFAARYKKDIKLGTIISITMPFSIAFGIAMTVMLLIFMYVGIPLGPA